MGNCCFALTAMPKKAKDSSERTGQCGQKYQRSISLIEDGSKLHDISRIRESNSYPHLMPHLYTNTIVPIHRDRAQNRPFQFEDRIPPERRGQGEAKANTLIDVVLSLGIGYLENSPRVILVISNAAVTHPPLGHD